MALWKRVDLRRKKCAYGRISLRKGKGKEKCLHGRATVDTPYCNIVVALRVSVDFRCELAVLT
jgi:hypothetical protein